MKGEFTTRSAEDALATVTEEAEVTSVPALTGGVGKAQHREFCGQRFIPQMPPDTLNSGGKRGSKARNAPAL